MENKETTRHETEYKKDKTMGIALLVMGICFILMSPIFIAMSWIIFIFPFVVGLIISYCGFRLYRSSKKKLSVVNRVSEEGMWVNARIVKTEKNGSWNDKFFKFKITCEWENGKDGQTYTFAEDVPLWIDPQVLMEHYGIQELKVKVNPTNFHEFILDTRILEDKIVDLTRI